MNKHIFFLSLILVVFANVNLYGQGPNCLGSTPICSSAPTTFPSTIGGTVPAGNNYGCLGAQPNPSWFTLTVGTGGSVAVNQTGPCDQDYAVWGPFNTLSAACAGLTAAPVSCNFSTASGNSFTLTGTVGQIFIMLLTNYGGCSGTVTISEAAGGGSLSCVPVCGVTASNLGPYCSGTTITLNATAATGATGYAWTGPNGFTATGQNVTIPSCTAAMAGVYTVTATGAATCTGSTTVVVNPTPTMNPTVTSPVCIGSPITLCSGAPVGALVAWTGPAYAALNACPTIPSATAAMAGNYTVTVLLNGCQSQQILPVVVNPAPTVTPISPITLCSGATVPAQTFTGTPATATYTWTNNQTSIGLAASGNGGLPSFTATNNSATPVVATVSVVPHLGTCNGTASNFTITVNPAPTITVPASNVYCEGATVPAIPWTTSSATATVAWTNNNTATGMGASGTGTIPSFTASPVTSQVISTITATPSQGACVGTPVTFTLAVSNAPVATITDIGPLCSNVGFQTLVAATPGGTWSGPGIINTSSGLFNPLIAGAGTTPTITYTLNLPNQCPASDITQIQIISVPLANAGVNQSVCQGQTVNLNGSFTNSSTGAETFAWTPTTNLTNSTTLTPTYTANSTQTYTLTVSSGICSSTDNVVVTMLPQSNATINAAGPYCADVAPVVLTAAQTGGVWSGTGITNAATGAFNPALANVGPNTITYSIAGSCPSTDTQTIIIYAVPDGTITPAGPFCQSALPVTLTAASTGGTWSGTGINNASTGSFGSTTLAASTYAITYTTSGNCPRTFNQNIVVNANTNATISAAGPYCADVAPVVLTAAQTGGVWSGTGITNTATGAFNPALANVGPNTITYSIGGPCPSTDTQSIVIYAVPDGTITPAGPFCQSALPVTLTAASTGGTWSGTGINNASTGSFGSTTLAANSYTVTYNTGGNCPHNFTQTIVVNANTNATINAAGPYCADVAPVVLTAAQTGGVWSGTGITNTATGAFNPALANVGPNTITYSIAGACPSTDTQLITIYAVPNGAITPAGPFCQSALPVTLTAATTGGTWSGTGINNASTGSFGSTTLAANTYPITYTTSGNCPRTFNQNIVVNASTNATINAAGPFCSDDAAVILTAAQSGGTWSGPGITNASTGAFNPGTANISNTITYSIGGPCPSTDTQVIVVNSLPDGTITPAGPFCQSSLPFTLTAASTGGTWSGTGINNTSTGSFGSNTLAASSYTVTYNTGGNCPQVFTETIVVNANTNATIAAAGPYCADVAPVVLTAAQTGGTWSGTGITSGVTGAFNPALAIVGPNTITYSIGGPCPSTDTQTILIYAVPDGTITPAGPFCQSDLPVTLTAASTGGIWSGTGINSASTGSFGSTTLAANTYTITYNTGGNCPHNFTQPVVVNANVDATITPQANICADASPITFQAANLGGVWSGNGITNPATGTFDPSIVTPTTQTITYTISGACPDTDTQTIDVYPVYDGTITPAGPFCQSALPVILTAASTGGTWSGTGFNNVVNGSFGSPNLAGNTYTVTYTTAGSCPRVFTGTVVVNANVNATISNVNPLCANVAPFNLTAVDPGGTWSGTGITDAVAGTFNPSIATGNPTITYTIPGSCPSTDTQVITVYAVYDGTITPAGPFCQADLPITLSAASTGGTWSGTGINSASAGTFGSASLAANSYTITYTTQGNCSQANTTTVVVNANVDATVSAVADVCNDAPAFNMSAVDAGGTWSGQGVNASGTFAPNSVTPNTYTITYSIGGACPDTDTQTIVVLPVPDGTITPAGPFCQDALPQTLTAASTGGTWSGTGITSSANGTFGASNTPAGNYSITYTTPGACSHSFNQVVQVIENLNATIASAGPFCEDASPFTLTAASAGGVWSGTGAITAGGQISPSTLGAGTYTFNYNINNSGCLSSDNVQVIVNALPQPSFTTSTTNGCSPLSVTFTNTSNPLGSICVWYVNGTPSGNGNTHSEVFTGSSCEDIGIMITDAAGCSQSITMTDLVCVNPNPSASFSWSPIEPMLGGAVVFENTSIGGTTYTWDINGQGASGESVTYNVPAATDGEFTACIEVVGPGGCMDSQCYTVSVSTESYIFVPNSFTPDADGTNDVFAPTIVGLTKDFRYSFRVYDRWGDVIFETNDPSDVWTGNVHDGGYYAQADAYVYEIILQLRAGEPPFRKVGSIVLIR